MTDCLFCRIVAGEIPGDVVHETGTTLAFRDIQPKAKTHVLVIPKQHHDTLAALAAADPALTAELFAVAGQVAAAEGVAASGYRLISNIGPDSGQEVDHVHVHLLGGEKLGGLARSRVDSTP